MYSLTATTQVGLPRLHRPRHRRRHPRLAPAIRGVARYVLAARTQIRTQPKLDSTLACVWQPTPASSRAPSSSHTLEWPSPPSGCSGRPHGCSRCRRARPTAADAAGLRSAACRGSRQMTRRRRARRPRPKRSAHPLPPPLAPPLAPPLSRLRSPPPLPPSPPPSQVNTTVSKTPSEEASIHRGVNEAL